MSSGLIFGIATFAAAPLLMAGLGIAASIIGAGAIGMGLGGLLSLPVSAAAHVVDRIIGRDPPLGGLQVDDLDKMLETRRQLISREKQLEEYAGQGTMPRLKDALPQDVYAKLSDEGKMAALTPVFEARAAGFGDVKTGGGTKLKDVFGKFADNASKILAAEQVKDAALSPGRREIMARLYRARDRAAQA